MPNLKDTELRVLLVVLRHTVGWNKPDQAAVLSYKRLMAATGRHSEAISKALTSLSAQRLIHTSGRRKNRLAKQSGSISEQQ